MKKAAMLFAVLGSVFFAACDRQESETVESTTETVEPATGETVDVETDTTVTTETE